MSTSTSTRTVAHAHGRNVCYCEACQAAVEPVRPALAWRLAMVGTWAACLAMVAGLAFTGFLAIGVVFMAPAILFLGAFLMAPVHEAALRPPLCPECGRVVTPAFDEAQVALGRVVRAAAEDRESAPALRLAA